MEPDPVCAMGCQSFRGVVTRTWAGSRSVSAQSPVPTPKARRSTVASPCRAGGAPAVQRPVAAVLGYGFCHACLSAAWHLEDGDVAEAERSLATARAIQAALKQA